MSPERGIAYGGRPLWQRSPRSSPRTGKPSTWRRGAGGFDGIQQGGTQDEKRRNCTERHTHWRAGCAERRTSGSEGGRRKSASGNRSNSPPAYPTHEMEDHTRAAVLRHFQHRPAAPSTVHPQIRRVYRCPVRRRSPVPGAGGTTGFGVSGGTVVRCWSQSYTTMIPS